MRSREIFSEILESARNLYDSGRHAVQILDGALDKFSGWLGPSMRPGAVMSGVFHTVMILVAIFGLPSLIDPPTTTLIPIEMVMLEEEEHPEPDPKPEPKPMAKVPTPEPEPKPEPKPEPPKEVAEAEAVPLPEPAPPEPEVKPEAEAAKPPPPKPRRRPDIKVAQPEKPKEKKQDRLTSILKDVEKMKDKPQPRREQIAAADVQGPTSRNVSTFEKNAMVSAIQKQLRGCWRLDPGARGAEDMVIEIRVQLNQDGTVRDIKIADVGRMFRDAFFRSAAENAKRAINICSPFQLPPQKYATWRELTLLFNPKEMFGS